MPNSSATEAHVLAAEIRSGGASITVCLHHTEICMEFVHATDQSFDKVQVRVVLGNGSQPSELVVDLLSNCRPLLVKLRIGRCSADASVRHRWAK